MLTSRPIIAFVATTNPSRAKAFYAKTLQPAGYTVLGWIVPDIARAVRALAKRGVTFQRYERMPQDDLGIWSAPSGARVAWFSDPDGNTLSLTELERPTKKKTKTARQQPITDT